MAEIAPETTIQVSEVEQMGDRPLCESPIVIAEDSVLLQKMINDCLQRAGFMNIKNFNNGQEAGTISMDSAQTPGCMTR